MKKKEKIVKITMVAIALLVFISAIAWLLIPKRVEVIAPADVEKIVKSPATMLTTEYTYEVADKTRKFKNIASMQKIKDLYRLKRIEREDNKKDVIAETIMNMEYETREWKYENPNKSIKVTAIRKGNMILLTGTFDKKENNKKEIYIDDRKWLQAYQVGIMNYAIKGKKDSSFEFWSLNPDDPGSAMVLFAAYKGEETIEIKGFKIKTAKVRIGLAGLMSAFWSGDYWYRVPEGIFVKAKINGDMAVLLKGEKQK